MCELDVDKEMSNVRLAKMQMHMDTAQDFQNHTQEKYVRRLRFNTFPNSSQTN